MSGDILFDICSKDSLLCIDIKLSCYCSNGESVNVTYLHDNNEFHTFIFLKRFTFVNHKASIAGVQLIIHKKLPETVYCTQYFDKHCSYKNHRFQGEKSTKTSLEVA